MSAESSRHVDLSVVIPVYNEQDNLAPLLAEVGAALAPLSRSYEVLFVNDGSSDGSGVVLERLRASDAHVRVVTFARNAGQTAAMDAGFRRARGEIVITLDADLQNDPADIPRLLADLPGWDAVVGVRARRRDSLVRRISSRVANYVRNRLSDETISDTGCSLKAYRRTALSRLVLFNGMHRFLPTLLKMEGFRVRETMVGHRPRRHGESKYGIGNRLVPSFMDLMAVRWMKRRKLRYEVKDES
ncbi:MAG TPA: glycosyltransferase family 2 protein [Candidatus Polarisedimenticolia bacterium]|nr:glycosyltransferase family 2 protein [Candidatus Polarisedimenticolia bacterium]